MVRKKEKTKKEKRFIVGCLLLLVMIPLPVLLPLFTWRLASFSGLDIVIMDKTVPDRSYREHGSLVWVLNHFKFSDRLLKISEDYAGIHPVDTEEKYRSKSLSEESGSPDVIYLADTYGVYGKKAEQNIKGISRGLTVSELGYISDNLKHGAGLIAEFNSINWPTSEKVKENLSQKLGIIPTDWVGIHFDDLSKKSGGIAKWKTDLYEKLYRKKWNYKGSGFIFTRAGKDLFVIRNGIELTKEHRLIISFKEQARKRFNVNDRVEYPFIVEWVKANGADVLAEFQLNLTPQGKKLIEKHGFPGKFPAVLEKKMEHGASCFYFAGDFSDRGDTNYFLKIDGIVSFFKLISTSDDFDPVSRFYWNVYVPMIKKIFEEYADYFKSIRKR